MAYPALINQYTYIVPQGVVTWTTSFNVVIPGGTIDPCILIFGDDWTTGYIDGASWNGKPFTIVNPGGDWYAQHAYLFPGSTGSFTITGTKPFFITNSALSIWVLSGAVAISANSDVVFADPFDTHADVTLTTKSKDSLVAAYSVNVNPTFSGTAPSATVGGSQTLVTNQTSQSWFRQTTSYTQVATAGTATLMTVSAPPTNQMDITAFEIMSVRPTSPSNFFLVFPNI